MKTQKFSVIDPGKKPGTKGVAFGISKLILFFLVLSAVSMKGQTSKAVIAPYPATNLGQVMLIDESSSLWEPVKEVAEVSRAHVQAFLDAYPDEEPTESWSCKGSVCCITRYYWHGGDPYYITTCIYDNGQMDTIRPMN